MKHLRSLWRDERGVTAVEFALFSPVFLMALMGVFDLAHNIYTEAMMTGAIQKSARDSSIEGAADNEAALDARVARAVKAIAPTAQVTFARKSYSSFGDVGTPEDYTDIDADGACNNGEPFEDANGNGQWDADRGRSGFGGARDAVLYSVNVEYDRFFPIARFIGVSETMDMTVSTVLRNQPYGLQDAGAPAVGNCP